MTSPHQDLRPDLVGRVRPSYGVVLAAGTPVLTPYGPLSVEELAVGDRILSASSEDEIVVADTRRVGPLPMYSVLTSDGVRVVTGATHSWSVKVGTPGQYPGMDSRPRLTVRSTSQIQKELSSGDHLVLLPHMQTVPDFSPGFSSEPSSLPGDTWNLDGLAYRPLSERFTELESLLTKASSTTYFSVPKGSAEPLAEAIRSLNGVATVNAHRSDPEVRVVHAAEGIEEASSVRPPHRYLVSVIDAEPDIAVCLTLSPSGARFLLGGFVVTGGPGGRHVP